MSQVEAISQTKKVSNADALLPKASFEEAESFSDALEKMKHGNLKLSEKQLSIAGTICIAFAANIMLFSEKLKLAKWGKLSPIVGALTLIAGSIGLLFCAESFGKKAERKILKLFEEKETPKEIIAQQNKTPKTKITTPNKPLKSGGNIPTENYKNLGLNISHN